MLTPMSDESMLQALEHTADQIDHLAEIIDECLTMAEAGVLMSVTTRQKYTAEMAELRGQQERLRETIAAFWVQIGRKRHNTPGGMEQSRSCAKVSPRGRVGQCEPGLGTI